MSTPEKIILYHSQCLDGFGAAFAAWKKFGNNASYIPVRHNEPPPEKLNGKEIYIVDFSYPKQILLGLEQNAARLVVLDHHIGTKETIEAIQEHIFDNERSGAGIAWRYFHPDTPLPRLLAYVQEGDLWRFTLPHHDEIKAFLSIIEFNFHFWEKLSENFDNETVFQQYVERGRAYWEYFNFICRHLAAQAEPAEFEGYRILTVNAPRFFRSELGHELAIKRPPFSVVWYRDQGMLRFSLRGDGSIDLTKIAARYKGSGHYNAAAFSLRLDAPLPFKIIKVEK